MAEARHVAERDADAEVIASLRAGLVRLIGQALSRAERRFSAFAAFLEELTDPGITSR